MTELIHATAVAIGGRGVLLTGPSGAGKSDLALRLIDRGAQLVSDDQVLVEQQGDSLIASAPGTIAGKMEVRGIGIVAMPYLNKAPIALIIALDEEPERMPEARTRTLCGLPVPLLALAAHEAAAAIKVERALAIRDTSR